MLPKNTHLCEGLFFTFILFYTADSEKCLKRQSVGNRENNVYECTHPVYSECCEHSNRFTCCEPAFSKNLRQQLQLWGGVAVMVAVGAIVYSCWSRDQEFIQSETLKQAAHNIGRKFRRGADKEENGTKGTSEDTSEKTQLTSFSGPNQRSPLPPLPTHFYHDV